MGPKICDGLNGCGIGGEDGDLGGGVGVQVQLGLENSRCKGGEVGVEGSSGDTNVPSGVRYFLAVRPSVSNMWPC